MKKLLLIVGLLFGCLLAGAQVLQHFDINTGTGNSNPNALTVFGNQLVFVAGDSAQGHELWSSDDNFNVSNVNDNNTGGDGADPSIFSPFAVINDTMYYSGQDNNPGYRVFAYDGSHTPYAVNNPNNVTTPGNFTVFGGQLYYSGQAGSGTELMNYNPITGAHVQVTGTAPGSVYYDGATVFNGKIYYAGNVVATGIELYAYDPATGNYGIVDDINPNGAHSSPASMQVFNGKLYFTADNGTDGHQLYAYDGINTPQQLTNVAGTTGPTAFSYTFFNNNIYFGIVTNGPSAATHALYKYDIAGNSTSIVKTILSSQSALIGNLTVYNSRLYFNAKDSLLGEELWMYDGNNPPSVVADVRLGGGGSAPNELTVFKNHLYFSAKDDQVGRELFRFSDAGLGLQNVRFQGRVVVYPNPARDVVHIDMELPQPATLAVTITDLTGKLVYNGGRRFYQSGRHTTQIDLGNMVSGTYFYHMTDVSGRTCVAGKLVKE